jgi:hypothetical protein
MRNEKIEVVAKIKKDTGLWSDVTRMRHSCSSSREFIESTFT